MKTGIYIIRNGFPWRWKFAIALVTFAQATIGLLSLGLLCCGWKFKIIGHYTKRYWKEKTQ